MDSGMLSNGLCENDPRGSRITSSLFYKDDVPKGTCDVHIAAQVDKLSGHLIVPGCPEVLRVSSVFLKLDNRFFPVAGIKVSDQGYVYNTYDNEGRHFVPEGMFPGNSGTAKPYNRICIEHYHPGSHEPEPPEVPEE